MKYLPISQLLVFLMMLLCIFLLISLHAIEPEISVAPGTDRPNYDCRDNLKPREIYQSENTISHHNSTLRKEKIIIKLGGGLITDKSRMKTIKPDNIRAVCEVLAKIIAEGYTVVLVHGAGSFGHLEAKKWKLEKGFDEQIAEGQKAAIKKIKADMAELNQHILNHLERVGIKGISYPASTWISGSGSGFHGDISLFHRSEKNTILVTHGDLVKVPEPEIFGILSGDDLMVRLCNELPDVSHCLFLLGDVEGLLTKPPHQAGAQLIPLWSEQQPFEGQHNELQDVTGGIFLKADSAGNICKKVQHVWMLDGRKPERTLELIQTGSTRGTKIVP